MSINHKERSWDPPSKHKHGLWIGLLLQIKYPMSRKSYKHTQLHQSLGNYESKLLKTLYSEQTGAMMTQMRGHRNLHGLLRNSQPCTYCRTVSQQLYSPTHSTTKYILTTEMHVHTKTCIQVGSILHNNYDRRHNAKHLLPEEGLNKTHIATGEH